MITKIMTVEELKQILGEIFFNKQSKLTKVSDESVINAYFYGMARVAQKAMKDIAIVESHIFPQYASGTYLDSAGQLFASLSRNGASGSSTFLLIIADSGTTYPAATTVFSGQNGVDFELSEDFTVGDSGYGYALVRSVDTGLTTNVEANQIIQVSPEPTGHIAVTNEFIATGGRDIESDELYRARIKSHPNLKSKSTLLSLTEAFRLVNDNILRLFNLGFDENGKIELAVVLQNGADLTESELDELLDASSGYLALSDLNKFGDVVGVTLSNVTWYEVNSTTGIDFRVQLYDNYDPDEVRKNIQIQMSRYMDIRTWEDGGSIEWDDLLDIVKRTRGVRYVPDGFFNPSADLDVPNGQLPRIKNFVMRDLDGNIISDNSGVISPVFYPILNG